MTTFDIEDPEEFLAHYGIKGMKWGVRRKRGSDGTVSGGLSERQKKKVAKAKKQAADADAQIKKIESKKYKAPWDKSDIKQWTAVRDKAAKRANDIETGQTTDRQRNIKRGAAFAGVVIAAGATYALVQSGEGHRLAEKGRAFMDKTYSWKAKPELSSQSLDADQLFDDVVKGVNPDFGGIGTKQNCRRCTFAYELRRRGFDVTATKTTNAHGQSFVGLDAALDTNAKAPKASGKLASIFKAASKLQNNSDPSASAEELGLGISRKSIRGRQGKADSNDIFRALSRQPDGSRGELGVGWNFGGGHSMVYERVRGKTVVFDTQTRKKFTSPVDLDRYFAQANGGSGVVDAGFTRLDNVALNHDFLKRWVKNA